MRTLALLSTVLALAVALPAHAQEQQAPLRDENPRPMQALDPIDGPSRIESRQRMARQGACLADRSTEKARSVLLTDFRTSQYRQALRVLSESNRDCFGARGVARGTNALVVGAMAERLLQVEGGALKARLARAAAGSAPAAFGASDQLAQCVVRSMPDETSALFLTEVGTEAETAAVRALDFVVGRCAQGSKTDIKAPDLRAILATAAFRNVEANK